MQRDHGDGITTGQGRQNAEGPRGGDHRRASGARPHITYAELDLEQRGLALYRELAGDTKDNSHVRQRLTDARGTNRVHRLTRAEDEGARKIIEALKDVVDLVNAGQTEAKCRKVEALVRTVLDECFAGTATPALSDLDRQDPHSQGREEVAQMTRLVEGESPMVLRLEAEACESDAALKLTRARVCRRRARQIETSRQLGRERVGLAAAGGR